MKRHFTKRKPLDCEVESIRYAKVHLCRIFTHELCSKGWTAEYAAIELQTNRTVITRMRMNHVDKLSFNQLFRFLGVVAPRFKILINSNPWHLPVDKAT
jgi:hypothetical protein